MLPFTRQETTLSLLGGSWKVVIIPQACGISVANFRSLSWMVFDAMSRPIIKEEI